MSSSWLEDRLLFRPTELRELLLESLEDLAAASARLVRGEEGELDLLLLLGLTGARLSPQGSFFILLRSIGWS